MTSELEFLQPGEPIGVAALSGPVDGRALAEGLAVIRSWGHPWQLAPNLENRLAYLAGTDDDRVAGLEYLVAGATRVIVAARGGYGATRILDRLPWSKMVDRRVVLVGFSDLTAVLEKAWSSGCGPQIHGPMVAAGLARVANAERLYGLLAGRLCGGELFRFGASQVVRPGRVVGRAAAFNLAMLTALAGTPDAPDLRGRVVFLEEVGEPMYRLDRMLTQLRVSASFSGVKALISGSLRRCGPALNRRSSWRRLLLEAAPDGAVVVDALPFGHQAANMAFPIGVPVEVDTRAGRVTWRE